jgi:hypothetical protein
MLPTSCVLQVPFEEKVYASDQEPRAFSGGVSPAHADRDVGAREGFRISKDALERDTMRCRTEPVCSLSLSAVVLV